MFAEGSTQPPFEAFFAVTNPSDAPAAVTITHRLTTGATVTRTRTVPGKRRATVMVSAEDPALADAEFWTAITSDQPVVAERVMYFPGAFNEWVGAHASPGLTQAASRWGLAEGVVGQPAGPGNPTFHTFLPMANPGVATATVELRFVRQNGSAVIKSVDVPGGSRVTLWVNGQVPELANEAFGVVAGSSSATPFILERSIYWGSPFWGGSNSAAVPLP